MFNRNENRHNSQRVVLTAVTKCNVTVNFLISYWYTDKHLHTSLMFICFFESKSMDTAAFIEQFVVKRVRQIQRIPPCKLHFPKQISKPNDRNYIMICIPERCSRNLKTSNDLIFATRNVRFLFFDISPVNI